MISIEKCSQLEPAQLAMVKQLVEMCDEYDHCETKFYWSVSEDRVNEDLTDFIFKVEGHIIAYLAMYYFGPSDVEICAVVHPEFRNQGIFKRLWEEAQMELKNQGAERCLFLTNALASGSQDCLRSIGANFHAKEFRFEAIEPLEIKSKRNVKIKRATRSDLEALVEIDVQATGSDEDEISVRMGHIIDDKDRRVYIGMVDDEPAIKLHILFEDNMAYLHDFCVSPTMQKKGYAGFFLKSIINSLFEKDHIEKIELDAGTEELAKFYKNNGLTKLAAYEYWAYYLTIAHPNYMTLH